MRMDLTLQSTTITCLICHYQDGECVKTAKDAFSSVQLLYVWLVRNMARINQTWTRDEGVVEPCGFLREGRMPLWTFWRLDARLCLSWCHTLPTILQNDFSSPIRRETPHRQHQCSLNRYTLVLKSGIPKQKGNGQSSIQSDRKVDYQAPLVRILLKALEKYGQNWRWT